VSEDRADISVSVKRDKSDGRNGSAHPSKEVMAEAVLAMEMISEKKVEIRWGKNMDLWIQIDNCRCLSFTALLRRSWPDPFPTWF